MASGRVFISYAQESEPIRAHVLALASRMRQAGVDAWIDRYVAPPIVGWPLWMEGELRSAEWVLLVCTAEYRRRFDQTAELGVGRGVTWEGRLIRSALYDKNTAGHRFIPVVFSEHDSQHVPAALGEAAGYLLDRDYDRLLRHIRQQPEIEPPPLPEAPVQSAGIPAQVPIDAPTGVPSRPQKVLIVACNREDHPRLNLGREVRDIMSALRGGPFEFEARVLWAATERDFVSEILDFRPDILHMCGHGTPEGGLALEHDPDAETDGAALVRWLQIGPLAPLKIAILNFCYSHAMLDALAPAADLVVGPIERLDDRLAIEFSTTFYMALAAGGSGPFSYHLGKSAIEMRTDALRAPAPVFRDVRLLEVDNRRALANDYSVRCREPIESVFAARETIHGAPKTIAFLASEPHSLPRLRLDREFRRIRAVLPPTRFRLEQRWATRPNDLLQTLMHCSPEILHLSGHGDCHGAFQFEDDERGTAQVPADVLASVLTSFHRQLECVVLMFEDSVKVARELSRTVACTVSLRGCPADVRVIRFLEVFYQLVGAGQSFRDAYRGAAALIAQAGSDAPFVLTERESDVAEVALPATR